MFEFSSKRYDASIATYIITKTNTSDFRSASIAIAYLQSQARDTTSGQFYIQLTKDISRVICLYMCSNINSELYRGDMESAVVLAMDLAFLCSFFIERDDPHYAQVIQNVSLSFSYAEAQLTNDYAKQTKGIQSILKSFESATGDATFDISEPTEEFKALKEKVDFVDSYGWIEGWKSTELASLYHNEFAKFKNVYQTWIDIHYRI
jgi:hypothetical protein